MDVHKATEIAYKNGYNAGIEALAEKIKENFDNITKEMLDTFVIEMRK